MRPKRSMRNSRPVHLAAGALMLAIPASAVALSAGQANAQGALQISLSSRQIAYGESVNVLGTASPANAGQKIVLEFARAGTTSWQTLGTTTVGPRGHFKFAEPLKVSGLVRALPANAAASSTGTSLPVSTNSATVGPSVARPVRVASRFRLRSRSINMLGGRPVDVRGRLLPELAGRRVVLEGRFGGHWRTLTGTRTGRHGGFDIRYSPRGLGRRELRVRFSGDRLNSRTSRGAGQVTVFTPSVASWYNDGGATACGFHAGFGVANRTLPCGTKVTFSYNGRTVTAVVDDRGPFVGGRTWDLNQNTAAALGFGGVGTVWATA